MRDYTTISLAEARADYLAGSTTGMPIAGLIAWAAYAVAALLIGERLPFWAPFVTAAIPFPLALVIDRVRGAPGLSTESRHNPVTQLFMRFITVVALLIPFVIIAARAAGEPDMLTLGLAILAGLVWVPHGWGADDPAGFIHFVARSLLCYAAYLLAPAPIRTAAIAGVVAISYLYAIAAMRKPGSAQQAAV